MAKKARRRRARVVLLCVLSAGSLVLALLLLAARGLLAEWEWQPRAVSTHVVPFARRAVGPARRAREPAAIAFGHTRRLLAERFRGLNWLRFTGRPRHRRAEGRHRGHARQGRVRTAAEFSWGNAGLRASVDFSILRLGRSPEGSLYVVANGAQRTNHPDGDDDVSELIELLEEQEPDLARPWDIGV